MDLKRTGAVALTLMLVLYWAGTWNPEAPVFIEPEWRAYEQMLEEYEANMPQPDPSKSGANSPDMFYYFDNLKRLDPATGEVPADGLIRAYQDLQRQGQIMSPRQTGNALTWVERGPNNVGGRTRAIMWDPNDTDNKAVFAGGVGGGMWYCDDITASQPSWTNVSSIFSNVAVTAITHDPSNPMTMYYGTGEATPNADALRGAGLWKSTDGGMNWNKLPATDGSQFYYCAGLQCTSNGDLYVASTTGLYRSQDDGASFHKVLGSGPYGALFDNMSDIDIAGNGDIYACVYSRGIYKSAAALGAAQGDSAQWTRLNIPYPGQTERILMTAGGNNPNYLYTVYERFNAADGIFKSTNGGTSWSSIPRPLNNSDYTNGQAWYDLTIDVDPNNPNRVFTGGLSQFRTINGGSNWSQISDGSTMHVDQHAVAFNPANSAVMLFANDGGVYYSDNGGSSQTAKNLGYNVTQFYTLAVHPDPAVDIVIGGTQDNGSHAVTTPQGLGTDFKISGADGSFCAINHQDPDTLYTTFQYQTVRRSRNGGLTTQDLTNPNLSQSDVRFINPLEMDPNNGNRIYQAANRLWRHNNPGGGNGFSWAMASTTSGQIEAIGISKSTPNLLYFSSSNGIYRLPNAHQSNGNTQPTRLDMSQLSIGFISCVAVNPLDGNHIVVTFSNYGANIHVAETRDAQNGQNCTWKDLSGNLPDLPCNWAVFEPNNPNGLIIGTDLGAFRCADVTQPEADIIWTNESADMGFPRIDMLEVREADNSLHAATHGRGIFSSYSYSQVPVADFGVTEDSACGGVVQFIDSSANVPNNWSWDFGDGTTSTLANPQHMYASSGVYTVTLIVQNPNGIDTISKPMNITVLPQLVANAGTDIFACFGDSIQLNASGGTQYEWFPFGGLSDPNSPNPTLIANGSRTFFLTVTDQYGCVGYDTVSVQLLTSANTNGGPNLTIQYPNDSVQLNGTGAATYSWSPATGLSCTTCPDPMVYVDTTTTYTVTGTSVDGCVRTDMVTVTVSIVGLDDELNDGTVLHPVYPNPVEGDLNIAYELGQSGAVSVELISMTGRVLTVVENEWQNAGSHQLKWTDRSNLAVGMYFLRLRTERGSLVEKLILK